MNNNQKTTLFIHALFAFICIIVLLLSAQFSYAYEKQVASLGILNAEIAIQDLEQQNLPSRKAQALLIEAQDAFTGVSMDNIILEAKLLNETDPEQAAVLFIEIEMMRRRGETKSASYVLAAQKAQAVEERKEETFTLYYAIKQFEVEITSRQNLDLSTAIQLQKRAMIEFQNEQFTNARTSIQEAHTALEEAILASSKVREAITATQQTAQHLVRYYWLYLLLAFGILLVLLHITYREYKLWREQLLLTELIMERQNIIEIIQQSQEQCFIQKTLSPLRYKKKLEEYKNRLIEIKAKIPVATKRVELYTQRRFWRPFIRTRVVTSREDDEKTVDHILGQAVKKAMQKDAMQKNHP